MRKNQGYTLIEMIVVIAIMGITLSMAVSSFGRLQANNRVSNAANELTSALKQGRSEALVQRRDLRITAINNIATTNMWGSKGWKITNPVSGQVFQEQHDLPSSIVINSVPVLNQLVFVAATGLITKTNASAIDNVVFTVCDNASKVERGIDVSVNRFGRVAMIRHATPVTCNS
jgi:prepilin-type N-terminal cleavage/methylation domain-containing protein